MIEPALGRGATGCARLLLAEFGSLAAVLAGSAEHLKRISGEPAATAITAARQAMIQALRGELIDQPVFARAGSVTEYLSVRLAHVRVEEMHCLFLSADLRMLSDEIIARGSRTGLVFDTGEILRRALELGAKALILAHNHPSGSTAASHADIHATRLLVNAATSVGIQVCDHLVITRESFSSLAAEGLL